MRRWLFFIRTGSIVILLTLIASFGVAQNDASLSSEKTIEEKYTARLKQQGFQEIEIERTWLGRLRFYAYAPGVERELVVNRKSGEILRDYWLEFDEDDRLDGFFDSDDLLIAKAWAQIEELADQLDMDPEELSWHLIAMGLDQALGAEDENDLERQINQSVDFLHALGEDDR